MAAERPIPKTAPENQLGGALVSACVACVDVEAVLRGRGMCLLCTLCLAVPSGHRVHEAIKREQGHRGGMLEKSVCSA